MIQSEQPAKLTHWMIYGAYGYTGELIAREAVKRGLDLFSAEEISIKLKNWLMN